MQDIEQLLNNRISKQQVHDLVETLDVKLMTSLENAEAKLMEHLENSHKEQTSQWDSLRVFQELKIKDLATKQSQMDEAIGTELVKRKDFDELRVTTLRLKERVEDDMDLVTRNVREAKDRMGEMTLRFSKALVGQLKPQMPVG